MKALLKSWIKRFEASIYWMGYDLERSLISFSIDIFRVEIRPFHWFSSNDVDRWRMLVLSLYISRLWFHLSIPYKKLPDHVPTERQLRRRNGPKEF